MPKADARRPHRIWLLVALLALVLLGTSCQYRFAIVGDSVTYSARDELIDRRGYVRSYGGLSIPLGRGPLREVRQAGHRVVVVALGGIDISQATPNDELARRIRRVVNEDLRGVPCVLWLDLKEVPTAVAGWSERARAFNALLHQIVEPRPGHHVVRWSRLAAAHPEWFIWDGIHLRPAGQLGFAALVSRAVRNRC